MSGVLGVVKFFNSDKGYGFVEIDGYAKDAFVHQNDVVTDLGRDLVEGDAISCDVEMRTRGLQALKVVVTIPFDVSAFPNMDDISGTMGEVRAEPQPGIFIPTKPVSAAQIIANHFNDTEIEELADYLLVSIS